MEAKEKSRRTFQIVKKIDFARFIMDVTQKELREKESIINYFDESQMTDESKLLTHWLCYIVDRGIPFERVWDVGGVIFSKLAYEFCKDVGHVDSMVLVRKLLSFKEYGESTDGDMFVEYDVKTEKKEEKRHFFFKMKYNDCSKDSKKILERYDLENKDIVSFTPRYYPADYRSIFYSLYTFACYGGFREFIKEILDNCKEDEKCKEDTLLIHLLYGLYRASYDFSLTDESSNEKLGEIIKVGDTRKIDTRKLNKQIEERAEERVKAIRENKRLFEKYDKYTNIKSRSSGIFHSKRALCSLRDFLMFPEFSKCFNTLVGRHAFDELRKQLKTLELPGDIWNNKKDFWECALGYPDTNGNQRKRNSSEQPKNQYIREVYNNLDESTKSIACPIQFDFTFDFVPRMCDKGNCNACIFGDKYNTEVLKKLCISSDNDSCNNDHLCPVIMLYCGYSVECNKDICLKEYF